MCSKKVFEDDLFTEKVPKDYCRGKLKSIGIFRRLANVFFPNTIQKDDVEDEFENLRKNVRSLQSSFRDEANKRDMLRADLLKIIFILSSPSQFRVLNTERGSWNDLDDKIQQLNEIREDLRKDGFEFQGSLQQDCTELWVKLKGGSNDFIIRAG